MFSDWSIENSLTGEEGEHLDLKGRGYLQLKGMGKVPTEREWELADQEGVGIL